MPDLRQRLRELDERAFRRPPTDEERRRVQIIGTAAAGAMLLLAAVLWSREDLAVGDVWDHWPLLLASALPALGALAVTRAAAARATPLVLVVGCLAALGLPLLLVWATAPERDACLEHHRRIIDELDAAASADERAAIVVRAQLDRPDACDTAGKG